MEIKANKVKLTFIRKLACSCFLLSLLIFVCLSQSDSSKILADAASGQTSEGLFPIVKNGKFGFIDKNGSVRIEPRYDAVQDFSEGLALVTLNRKKFFIDMKGTIAIQPENFEPINVFNNGRARGNITTRSPYTKGYIDKTGKIVIDDSRMGGACWFSEGLACVVTGKWGFIDTSGKFVIPPQFDEASPFSEGLASVTFWDQSKASRHKHGFIDKTGTVVIKPLFDIVQRFSEGVAAVGIKKGVDGYQFGFIDHAGLMIIKPQFDWTYSFNEGIAAVKVGEKWGYINKHGEMIIKPQFDKAEEFSDGLAAAAIKGKWGFIDKSGAFVIEPQFNEAHSFISGLAFVKVGSYDANAVIDVIGGIDTAGKWGYINKSGKYIWQPTN